MLWGMGKVNMCDSRNFPRNFRKISGKISGKFPVKCKVIRKREIEIVKRQNNILMKGLWENNPTIMLNSPVKYLRDVNFHPIMHLFPTDFIYCRTRVYIRGTG